MPTSFCRDANSYTQQYPVHLTASHERGYESRGWDAKAPAGSALSHLGGARSATAHPRELRFRPQWVQSRQLSKVHGMSASTTAPDLSLRRSEPAVWAITGREQAQQRVCLGGSLLDHLVGAGEQGRRDFEAECLGCLG